MTTNRKAQIIANFDARAPQYEGAAVIQKQIAARLANHVREQAEPVEGMRILEIGCGSGFLTRHLVEIFPEAEIFITDAAPQMVEMCRDQIGEATNRHFMVMDGEEPDAQGGFNLIVSAMAVQWFDEPLHGLGMLQNLLKPEGGLYYTTLQQGYFDLWREACREIGRGHGLLDLPEWPGVFEQFDFEQDVKNCFEFLKSIKNIGAHEPNTAYTPFSISEIRKCCDYVDNRNSNEMVWPIIFAKLGRL